MDASVHARTFPPAAETPAVEAAIAETPVVETPAVEATVAEAAIVETPAG
jgi:ribonuclease E